MNNIKNWGEFLNEKVLFDEDMSNKLKEIESLIGSIDKYHQIDIDKFKIGLKNIFAQKDICF